MQSKIKIPLSIQKSLRCPVCKEELSRTGELFICNNSKCNALFPIVGGVPVLINEDTSVFSVHDFVKKQDTTINLQAENKKKKKFRITSPSISKNITGKHNYENLTDLLVKSSHAPKVLVIGGSIIGQGMGSLIASPSIELIESDVSFGIRTMLICDAHDIPFENSSFDGVIIQAVLEHVVDPYRCVDEIYRVLKKNGFVYAETPFMQQVHMGRYDFTRFTHLGHRRLFRRFEEIDSGAVCGPGMALAWSYRHFLLCFTNSKKIKRLILVFTGLTSFYLKYFDYYLVNKVGVFDSASGYYFLGKKADKVLSDRELIALYKGAL